MEKAERGRKKNKRILIHMLQRKKKKTQIFKFRPNKKFESKNIKNRKLRKKINGPATPSIPNQII